MLSFVKAVLEGRYPPQEGVTPGRRIAAGIVLMLVLVGAGYSLASQAGLLRAPTQAQALGAQLRALASELRRVDKTGDAAGAMALFDRGGATFRAINDAASTDPGEGVRACQLAMVHLVGGIESVAKGGRWLARDRFEASVSDCR